MINVALRETAIKLRKRGFSYNLINKQVPVSKSTLSLWLRDIPFSPNKKVRNRIRGAVLNVSKWSYENKRRSLELAKITARKKLGSISSRDLFLLGLGLYIGEGEKSHGNIRIINSDPRVISLAIRWFEDSFGLKTKNFSLTIHLYPDNNVEESIVFWSNITGIPKNQFTKTYVDKRKKKSKKRGMLRHGTAHLHVQSRGKKEFGVLLFRTIISLIDGIYQQVD